MLPRLRARRLVNTRNTCFANAILQLLINSPPFWNLFKEFDDLKGQRGAGGPETGGGATPLVDATSQPAAGRPSRAADEEKKDNNVADSLEPTYLYDAMKEKRQLRPLLDGQQQDAEEFLCLYLDALDEELPAVLPRHQSVSSALDIERPDSEASQAGQAEVTNLVESPTTRIFGGKFRSPVRAPNQPDPVSENWRSLHLDIQPDSVLTVEDALMRVFQSQSTHDGPSGLRDARQQMLGASTHIMVPNAQPLSEPPHYKLYGVLYITGNLQATALHARCSSPNGDGNTGEDWLHIDDEVVTRMGHEDVFGRMVLSGG
ncbi:hypothetical protein BGY98DRAFT_1116470 [Russula aff. rugulosa BPL654]|nr:hypothetical protein BGY98DRAFT_1116470 [Russula aff. rugulosa BPL654]